jgi:hypothetical protein
VTEYRDAGEQPIDEVRRLGNPLVSQVAPMTYGKMLGLWDAFVVNGTAYFGAAPTSARGCRKSS